MDSRRISLAEINNVLAAIDKAQSLTQENLTYQLLNTLKKEMDNLKNAKKVNFVNLRIKKLSQLLKDCGALDTVIQKLIDNVKPAEEVYALSYQLQALTMKEETHQTDVEATTRFSQEESFSLKTGGKDKLYTFGKDGALKNNNNDFDTETTEQLLEEAAELYENAYQLYLKISDPNFIEDKKTQAITVQNGIQQAIKRLQKLEETPRIIRLLADMHVNLGIIYRDLFQKYDLAIVYFNRAHDLLTEKLFKPNLEDFIAIAEKISSTYKMKGELHNQTTADSIAEAFECHYKSSMFLSKASKEIHQLEFDGSLNELYQSIVLKQISDAYHDCVNACNQYIGFFIAEVNDETIQEPSISRLINIILKADESTTSLLNIIRTTSLFAINTQKDFDSRGDELLQQKYYLIKLLNIRINNSMLAKKSPDIKRDLAKLIFFVDAALTECKNVLQPYVNEINPETLDPQILSQRIDLIELTLDSTAILDDVLARLGIKISENDDKYQNEKIANLKLMLMDLLIIKINFGIKCNNLSEITIDLPRLENLDKELGLEEKNTQTIQAIRYQIAAILYANGKGKVSEQKWHEAIVYFKSALHILNAPQYFAVETIKKNNPSLFFSRNSLVEKITLALGAAESQKKVAVKKDPQIR